MKVKIKTNKLQVGRSITVELLAPVRVNGKPTHKFVFSKTLKRSLWASGPLTPSAKEKLYEFWSGIEYFLNDARPESRTRIIAQVEAVIPRLSPEDVDALETLKKERAERRRKELLKPSPYDHLPIELIR